MHRQKKSAKDKGESCRIQKFFKLITPVKSNFRRKTISFHGHLIKTDKNWLIHRHIVFLREKKILPDRINEVNKDAKELNISPEDLKHKSEEYRKTIKKNKITFDPKIKKRSHRVYSENDRSWENKKNILGKEKRSDS